MNRLMSLLFSCGVLYGTGELFVAVSAQAMVVTTEADRKKGKQVQMRCVATNLQPGHILVLRAEGPDRATHSC